MFDEGAGNRGRDRRQLVGREDSGPTLALEGSLRPPDPCLG